MGTHLPHHKRPLRPSYLEWYEGEEQTDNMKATIVAVLALAATAFAAPVIEERQDAPTTTVSVRGGWGTRPWKRDEAAEALEKRQDAPPTTVSVRGGWGTRPWKRDETLEERDEAPATTVSVRGGWGTRPWK